MILHILKIFHDILAKSEINSHLITKNYLFHKRIRKGNFQGVIVLSLNELKWTFNVCTFQMMNVIPESSLSLSQKLYTHDTHHKIDMPNIALQKSFASSTAMQSFRNN